MGYRTQDNYDQAEREAWRKLAWRDRYNWRVLAIVALVIASFVVGLVVRMRTGVAG